MKLQEVALEILLELIKSNVHPDVAVKKSWKIARQFVNASQHKPKPVKTRTPDTTEIPE